MTFTVGQRVMTATSNPFVENRRGVIADVWTHDRYIMDDKGLRLVLHASELVPDETPTWDELLRLARGLFQMISREQWRDSGGDDGQGHYEGEYHAERIERTLWPL